MRKRPFVVECYIRQAAEARNAKGVVSFKGTPLAGTKGNIRPLPPNVQLPSMPPHGKSPWPIGLHPRTKLPNPRMVQHDFRRSDANTGTQSLADANNHRTATNLPLPRCSMVFSLFVSVSPCCKVACSPFLVLSRSSNHCQLRHACLARPHTRQMATRRNTCPPLPSWITLLRARAVRWRVPFSADMGGREIGSRHC